MKNRYQFNSSNLKAEMVRKGITKEMIARELCLSLSSIYTRFRNEKSWEYVECIAIKNKFFPDMELSYLFTYDNEV